MESITASTGGNHGGRTFDLAIAADTSLAEAEQAFRGQGCQVASLQTDLATDVQAFYELIHSLGRPVDVL